MLERCCQARGDDEQRQRHNPRDQVAHVS
jgi:hypothetical protein